MILLKKYRNFVAETNYLNWIFNVFEITIEGFGDLLERLDFWIIYIGV
jgi:hypothetical protein